MYQQYNQGGLNVLDFLLKCDFEVNELPIHLSNFNRQALLCWLLIYKHNFSPYKQ